MSITPITPVIALQDDNTALADMAETYSVMCDELAAMVEQADIGKTIAGRIVASSLGALHARLDGWTNSPPIRAALVAAANDTDEIREFATDLATWLEQPLRELHAALVDEVAALGWRAEA